MPTSQRDGHALPCLRERLQKLQAEKAEWAEARSRWQTEKLVLQHRVEEVRRVRGVFSEQVSGEASRACALADVGMVVM
jgi:hypothetical protein